MSTTATTTERPQPTARESALLKSMVDHVRSREEIVLSGIREFLHAELAKVRGSTTEGDEQAAARLSEVEQVLVQQRDDLAASEQARGALEEEVGRLRAELAATQASAREPVEAATRLVRSARRATDAAEDQIATMRRWARDSLTARARALAA